MVRRKRETFCFYIYQKENNIFQEKTKLKYKKKPNKNNHIIMDNHIIGYMYKKDN